MPVQGLVRLRKHQFGRQLVAGTKVAATRAYPATGTPSPDLAWEDPDIDTGSIDITAPPERGVPTLTADLSYPGLTYNDLTKILCGFFGGGSSPVGAGTARTWNHDPASTTLDDLDRFTYEFGDDVLTDWYQFGDGVVDNFEIVGPEGLGALTATASWRFGSIASTGSTDSPETGTVPTPGLSVSTTDPKIYLKDGAIYIASTVAGLAAGKVSDALHTFAFRGSGDIDEKRWANGTQTFDAQDMARASRLLELEATYSKTADTVGTGSESDAWMSDTAVNRYVRLLFVSTILAQAPSTFYGWTLDMPMRYYTRDEGESGGNSVVVLTGRAFYDPNDFDGILTSTLVNTLTDAQLGIAGS